MPVGWTILSPEDFSRDGNTYTWEREIIEYDIQVPVCTGPGTFQFSGNSVSVWLCPKGESVNPIYGDTSITVEQWSHDLCIGLMMPGTLFAPGSPVYLDLLLSNPGPEKQDALLFVILSLGTGDYWFYPRWHHYPPDIDWETITIEEDMTRIYELLPAFSWPSDAGRFEGAMFTAVIVHEGMQVSNIADWTFEWIP